MNSPLALPPPESGRRTRWPYLLLAGLTLLFCRDWFVGGKVPLMRDTFVDFMAWREFGAQALRAGHIPFWNPYSNCGQPFFAMPQSAILYPPNLIYLAVPWRWALPLMLALHLGFAACSSFALLRHWNFRDAPALLGSVAFTFGTLLVASMEFQTLFCSIVWIPCVMHASSLILERTPRVRELVRPVILLALVLAAQLLAGYPQTCFYTMMIAGCYVIARCVAHRAARPALVAMAAFLIAGALVACLALPQLLLTREVVPLSIRATEVDPHMEIASFGFRDLPSFLFPFWNGRPGYAGTWHATSILEFWLGTAYVGLVPLALAFAGAAILRQRKAAPFHAFLFGVFLAIAALGLLLAAGQYTPLYSAAIHLPIFNRFRWPSKALLIVAFSLPILAAMGAQVVLQRFPHRWLAITLVAVTYINLDYVSRQIHPRADASVYEENFAAPPLPSSSGGDLFRTHTSYASAHYILYGQRDPNLFHWARSASVSDTWLIPHAFRTGGGGDLPLALHANFMQRLTKNGPAQAQRLLDVLNVKYVITGPPPSVLLEKSAAGLLPPTTADIHERPSPISRAWLVHQWEAAESDEGAFARLVAAEFDPRAAAILRLAPGETMPPAPEGSIDSSEDRVESCEYDWNRITVACTTSAPALLVLSETYYPGWAAFVDDQPTPILRADVAFRGVAVPPGRHTVRFEYEPPAFRTGIWVSGLTLLALLTGLFLPRRPSEATAVSTASSLDA